MTIRYEINVPISIDQFIDILKRSGLAERRPVNDRQCILGMLEHGNLLVTAWQGEILVGVARSLTDFHYVYYLSDLAVDQAYQQQGIGKHLQHLTQQQLGSHGKVILLAAPAAHAYYQHIGYALHPRCWLLERDQPLS